jgi:hypothetical protein
VCLGRDLCDRDREERDDLDDLDE